MEPKMAVVLCAVAAFLGLLSAVLGFIAEATEVKAADVEVDIPDNACLHPDSPASGLAFASAFILLVGFILVNMTSGFFCCYKRRDPQCPPPSTPRPACNTALICFIFSWMSFVVAFILMLVGASNSSTSNMDTPQVTVISGIDIYACSFEKPGVFAAAACLSLISVALGITCSLNLNGVMGGASATQPQAQQGGAGIAMGQPQFPPPKQQSGYPYQQSYA